MTDSNAWHNLESGVVIPPFPQDGEVVLVECVDARGRFYVLWKCQAGHNGWPTSIPSFAVAWQRIKPYLPNIPATD